MKVIITEVQYGKAIDYYISLLLEPHEVRTSKRQHNSIFWTKYGEIIAEIENSEDFWLRENIWQDISRTFNLKPNETRLVINMWLKQNYGFEGLNPHVFPDWGINTYRELIPLP